MRRVDEKIEQMLETYKLMDELQKKKDEIGPAKRRQYLAQKYFPTDGEDGEDNGFTQEMESAMDDKEERLEDIIKDDDDSSAEDVYES